MLVMFPSRRVLYLGLKALASGAALLLTLGGTAVLAGPAFAEAGPAAVVQTQTQAGDSGQQASSSAQADTGHEDGTNDGETADDANEANEANEPAGHEDGTNDGEHTDAPTQDVTGK